MAATRQLIVNADDFGLSAGVNEGIIRAHEHGIVTSASLMVRGTATAEAATYAREHPALSLGLHIDLAEWEYRDATWSPLYEVVPSDDAAAVEAEVWRQLEAFRTLTGHDPTHLDSHQHVHRDEPAQSIILAAAAKLGVPLRHYGSAAYCGAFYGQLGTGEPIPGALSVDALIGVLRDLPPGLSELCCHPGLDAALASVYCRERFEEVETLCDPRVRTALEAYGIALCSFDDVIERSRSGA